MKKENIWSIPKYNSKGELIEYVSQIDGFNLPNHPAIIDKQITGCGFTEFCINPDKSNFDCVLCVPRRLLMNNKYEQLHKDGQIDSVYCVVNNYEKIVNFERDYKKRRTGKEEGDSSAPIEYVNSLKDDIYHYCYYMKKGNQPIKIIVVYDSFKYVKTVLDRMMIMNETYVVVDEYSLMFQDSEFKAESVSDFENQLRGLQKVSYVSATPMMEEYLEGYWKKLPFYQLDWKTNYPERVKSPTGNTNCEVASIYKKAVSIIMKYKDGNYPYRWVYDGNNRRCVYSEKAIIFLNYVTEIIKLIDHCGLDASEVNILCADTENNRTRIQSKLGKDFDIGKVPDPKKGEVMKKYTFCTRSVFFGCDFYDDTAKSYVFSKPNSNYMSIDLKLDLPQIIGRIRTESNPFKYEIEFYYEPSIIQKMTQEDFDLLMKYRDDNTMDALQRFKEVSNKQAQALDYLKVVKTEGYKERYLSVNRMPDGTYVPVVNNIVKAQDRRAFDLRNLDYRDYISVKSTIYDWAHVNNVQIEDEARQFLDAYYRLGQKSEKLRFLCESPFSSLEIKEQILPRIDQEIATYYSFLGQERCKANGYNLSKINQEIENEERKDRASEYIFNIFQTGSCYILSDIKKKLTDIYEKCGITATAKATDIKKWFMTSIRKITIGDGKRVNAYELISKMPINMNVLNIKASAYKNAQDTTGIVWDVLTILECIRSDHLKQQIEQVRNATDQKQKRELKQTLHNVTWQGVFTHRSVEGLKRLNGILCIDIDHLSESQLLCIKNDLCNLDFVIAAFRSPGGDGLKILVLTDNYDKNYYKSCYQEVEKIFINRYQVQTDSSCESIHQTCYLSYDPDMYLNPNPNPYHYIPSVPIPVQVPTQPANVSTTTNAQVGSAQNIPTFLPPSYSSMTDEKILRILDLEFSRYPQNYQDGHRTISIYQQASRMCKAGIEQNKAIDYLKSKFIPTGYNENKLKYEAGRAYQKNDFGCERRNYLPYQLYKNSKKQ